MAQPQLFTIAEHNVGKKFPMLDIYPYIKGSNNLKIKLAEVNKGTNTNTANQIAKSLNFSEIDSTETRLIEGSDTPVVPRKKSLWLRLLQLVHLQ
ncbi:hypothetical protein [Acinetobacter sp. UBA801]|uniref:hypothetical protein n=1 Tax=Acinetobacter sp. UBA801 TaxID=1945958 RepID=UPI0025B99351|nr:hypothetical protein [Acinetobacter sp. UBA801]